MESSWKNKKLGELTSYISKGIPPKYVEEESDETIRVLNQKCNRSYKILIVNHVCMILLRKKYQMRKYYEKVMC